MSDNLLGERYYGWRSKEWHGKGIVGDKVSGAVEVFERTGSYDVSLSPIKVLLPDGTLVPADGWNAAVREAIPEDPQVRVFGIVPSAYKLVKPLTFCKLWDKHVRRPVETLGVLGQGEHMFITTELPALDVRGDELHNYLFADLDFSGETSIYVRTTPVRVRCQNTVIAGRAQAVESYRIHHRGNVHGQLADILDGIYERAVDKTAVLKEAFQVLAAYRVSQDEALGVVQAVYPSPHKPRPSDNPDVMEQRLKAYELRMKSAVEHQAAVMDIFAGGGRAESHMDHPAVAGTAWGLYNAVAELADFGGRRSLVSADAHAISSVTGSAAARKEHAWDTIMEVVSPGSIKAAR